MTGALWFLIARTTRNRILRQVARLRSPRYAVAAVIGLAFVWLFFLSNASQWSAGEDVGDGPSLPMGSAFMNVVGVLFTFTLIAFWFGRGVSLALAFQPAEVQFLFSAPVSRRMLIAYRVARMQIPILLNVAIWMVFMRQWGVTSAIGTRFATVWAFFTLLSLHRLGIALLRVEPLRGVRRLVVTAFRGLGVAAVAALLAGALPPLLRFAELQKSEPMAGLRAVAAALETPPASYALAPFNLLIAPLRVATPDASGSALVLVAIVIALHFAWVLAMNVEFEEAAASASREFAVRMAAFREGRGAAASGKRRWRGRRSWLPLAPSGSPAVAIAWKNTLALARSGVLRSALVMAGLIAVMIFVMTSVSPSGGEDENAAAMVALVPVFTIVAMSFLGGPRLLRHDLRQDLLSLALLKTYPLRGSQIVLAELVSPALSLTVFQVAVMAAGFLAGPAAARSMVSGAATLTIVAPSIVALIVLNATNMAISNGAALMFPAWIRPGAHTQGVEALGQNVLVTVASLFALLLMLVLPVVGAALTLAIGAPLGPAGIVAAPLAGVLVLIGELAWLVSLLGGVLERTEPAGVN